MGFIIDGTDYSYYQYLFSANFKEVNNFVQSSCTLFGRNAYNVELSAQRYEELREDIIKTFGDDKELLDKNLKSLDTAFSNHLERVAISDARRVWIDQVMDRAAKIKGEEPPYELNKLALHKSFNFDKFEANAKNLIQQFAQEYIQQIRNGTSCTSAWENAVDIMTNSTKTTSVNNLSFSDFMILDGLPWSNATTLAANNASLSNRNSSFVNDPNLSEELRKILK